MCEERLYKEVQTANSLLEFAHVVDIEGWWEAYVDGKYHEYVRIRMDIAKQKYVVDVAGQDKAFSEELWRYKHYEGSIEWGFLRAKNIC